MNAKNMVLYGVLVLGLVVFGWMAATFVMKSIVAKPAAASVATVAGNGFEPTPERFQAFAADELPDKCKVPPGYDEKQWREHLSHHPDRYAECL